MRRSSLFSLFSPQLRESSLADKMFASGPQIRRNYDSPKLNKSDLFKIAGVTG